MAKARQSLEEGLEHSANKRGFTGKERHRYIGGALFNMGKAKTRNGHSIGAGRPKPPKAAPKPKAAAAHKAAHKAAPKPKAAAPEKPTPPKEKVSLTVKKSGDRYAIFNAKTNARWGSSTFRTPKAAKAEAKIEQDAYNAGYKRGRF